MRPFAPERRKVKIQRVTDVWARRNRWRSVAKPGSADAVQRGIHTLESGGAAVEIRRNLEIRSNKFHDGSSDSDFGSRDSDFSAFISLILRCKVRRLMPNFFAAAVMFPFVAASACMMSRFSVACRSSENTFS